MESAIYSYLIISAALCFHSAGAFNHEDSDILEVLVNSEIQIENGSMLDEDVELEIQNMTSHMEREMATLPPLLIPFCQYYNQTGNVCEPCFDGILIWNKTKAGEIAYAPCPSPAEIDPPFSGYAERECLGNGMWVQKADYEICMDQLRGQIEVDKEVQEEQSEMKSMMRISMYIYVTGFLLSNVAMIAAIFIFARYNIISTRHRRADFDGTRHLRCLRNKIHIQLLAAITMKNFLWMTILLSLELKGYAIHDNEVQCKLLYSCYKFFLLAQNSWMFVEGLYLFLVVVKALLTKTLEFKHCLLIGWGVPLLVIVFWLIANVVADPDVDESLLIQHKRCWHNESFLGSAANIVESLAICVILLVNMGFMASVIYTLVRKLRTSALVESKQYKKAVKATVILVPLLGGVYVLLFYPFSEEDDQARPAWLYLSCVIQSMQGFIVALVYCFLNGEVRSSMLKSHRRWMDEKTLPSSSDHWWQRRRRSSNFTTTRREDTETETCPSSSRRNSRRISQDTTSSSRRCSQVTEITDMNLNVKSKKVCKTSPLANRNQPTATRNSQENLKASNTVVFVSPVDPNKLEVCIA